MIKNSGWDCLKITLLLLLTACSTNGIIGGFWKSIRNYPYLVVIHYEVHAVCSGTIIMSSWILTAARCVHHGHVGVNGVVGIRIGVTNFDDKEQGTLVKKRSIHIHPYFKADVSYALTVNDIAIMQLEKHLEFGPHVHPVGVAFQRIDHNVSCVTAGWGVINPNVYLTGQVKDLAFWPVKGNNYLRDVEQQTDLNMTNCKNVMNVKYKESIHSDFHICTIHYPYAYNPWEDPTAETWEKPALIRRKRRTKIVSRYKDHNSSINFEPFIYWSEGFHKIRVNTDGPSYYDYGGPLMCYGQQVGIFAFPVANVKAWRPAARGVYTLLLRYVDWIDIEIELELNKQENNPPPKPDSTRHFSIWDDLNSGRLLSCNNIIIITMFLNVIFLK